jgi:hypothetical protein
VPELGSEDADRSCWPATCIGKTENMLPSMLQVWSTDSAEVESINATAVLSYCLLYHGSKSLRSLCCFSLSRL